MTVYPKIMHNGRFVEPYDAVIPVYTPALVGALGVYETILVRRSRYIALDEHLSRLQKSVAGCGLSLDVDMDTLKQWCFLLVAANHAEGLVRVLAVDLGDEYADIFLYQMSYTPPSPEEYEQGVPVILYHGERAMPAVKSFNTLVPGLARKVARAAGVHDALLVDRDGNVTEGSNCNVFVVQNETLYAPPPDAILEGTVMDKVVQLAGEEGIPFARRPLPLAELEQWDEAFLTSTRRGILPINRIGERELGRPGPVTRRLMAAYRAWEDSVLA